MNEQLERAYDALQQAHEAGQAEHAQQIADYIRELEAQAMVPEEKKEKPVTDKSFENPLTYGMAGAVAGRVLGPAVGAGIDTAARSMMGRKPPVPGAAPAAPAAPRVEPSMAPPQPARIPEPPPAVGQGAMKNVAHNVEEVLANRPAMSLTKQPEPGFEARPGRLIATPIGADLSTAAPPPTRSAAQLSAPPPAAPPAAPPKPSMLSRMSRNLAEPKKTPLYLGGAMAAGQGRDMYEQAREGNIGQAAMSGAGAVGGLGMLSRIKPIRAAGTLMGLGVPLTRMYKSLTEDEEKVERRAAGGLAGYAKGKMVKDIAAGKTPKALEDVLSKFRGSPEQTVTGAKRMAFPGIYKNPREIAAEAAARVAPENPAMKRLFGVSREDLYQMGKGRVGNLPGTLPGAAANPKGSAAAMGVMNPKNEQRLLDVMSEAEKHPELVRGMDPWYIMDPAYKRMEQMMGPEKAAEEYRRLNTLMGMASPGSEVLVEIPRGTAANYLNKQGRFEDFMQYGGMRTPERPQDFASMPGHMYHKTSQAAPMQKYLESGQMEMSSPKVPMYIEASGVPQTGFQTATPVGDAHWSRAVGLADTRGAKTIKGKEVVPGASVSNPEMTQLAPWWREKIAGELGIESVPAQARAWGAFAPQTGVESPIGAPKLELLTTKIMETADRLGVSPETARDMVLRGENWAGKRRGGLVHA